MIEVEKPQSYVQMHIADFLNDSKSYVDVQGELDKNLNLTVQWHLEMFIKLYLKLMKNPPTLGTFLAHITDCLPRMEDKEICYLKTMPDGKIYIFKRAYCWEGVETWRKCPNFRCLVQFKCCDLPCPYSKDYTGLNGNIRQNETTISESREEKQSIENGEQHS